MVNSEKPEKKAHSLSLPDQDGIFHTLEEYLGSWLILYFYPKDNTSGCTTEALAFSAVYEEMQQNGVPIIGISPDSPESHKKFITKHDLKLVLLADESHEVCKAYGVWKLKKMFGKEYYGVERSTFLINPEGIIRHDWRNVQVKGHVEAVREILKKMR